MNEDVKHLSPPPSLKISTYISFRWINTYMQGEKNAIRHINIKFLLSFASSLRKLFSLKKKFPNISVRVLRIV